MQDAAGYIVYVAEGTGPRFLLLRNARHHTWGFPKGQARERRRRARGSAARAAGRDLDFEDSARCRLLADSVYELKQRRGPTTTSPTRSACRYFLARADDRTFDAERRARRRGLDAPGGSRSRRSNTRTCAGCSAKRSPASARTGPPDDDRHRLRTKRRRGPGRLLRCRLHADLSVASRDRPVISRPRAPSATNTATRSCAKRSTRAWAAGTRYEPEDHRSSDALERERWHRFTLKIAQEIPELLPHHEAWLEQLAQFDTGDGWRLVPSAPRAPARPARTRTQGRDRQQLARGAPSHRLVGRSRGPRRLRRVLGRRRLPKAASRDLPGRAAPGFGAAVGGRPRRRHAGTKTSSGAEAAGITPIHLLGGPSTNRNPTTRHRTIADLSEIAGLL